MRQWTRLAAGAIVLWFVANAAVALEYDFGKVKNLDDWKVVGGDWKLNGGLLTGKTTGYQDLALAAKGSDKWTDYTWEAKGRLTAGRVWGVCFRYVDTSTNYRLNLYEDLDGVNNLYVYKRVAGAFSEVFKTPVGAIDVNKWYTLKLSIAGATIKAYLDGDLKIEVDDKAGTIKEGTVALQGETNTSFDVEVFRINGTDIPSPELAVEPVGKLAVAWASLKR